MLIVDQNNNLKHQRYGDIRFHQWTMHQIRLSSILTCLPDNPVICYSASENTRTVSLSFLCKLINTQVNSPTLRQPLPDTRSSFVLSPQVKRIATVFCGMAHTTAGRGLHDLKFLPSPPGWLVNVDFENNTLLHRLQRNNYLR